MKNKKTNLFNLKFSICMPVYNGALVIGETLLRRLLPQFWWFLRFSIRPPFFFQPISTKLIIAFKKGREDDN